MAKLDMGILGPFRGKVGTVVGYVWRGRAVMRGYQRHINYPDTASQQAERQWFIGMVRFAAAARQALLLGLRARAGREQMTEGNAFVKLNKGCFGRTQAPISDGYESIDYERITLAEGPAAPVRFTGAAVDGRGVLSVDYERNSMPGRAKAADRVYIYVYNVSTREGLLSAPAERRRGGLSMQLPDGWNSQNIRLWGFVVDGEGRASASACLPFGDALTSQERGDGLAVACEGGGFADGLELAAVEEGRVVLPESVQAAEHLAVAAEGGGGVAVDPLVHI